MRKYLLAFFLSTRLFCQLSPDEYICFTIAKSGTNLALKAIKLLTNTNQCKHSHFTYKRFEYSNLDPLFSETNMKCIVNVRDFRDILVSCARIFPYLPLREKHHTYYSRKSTLSPEDFHLWFTCIDKKWKYYNKNIPKRVDMLLDTSTYMANATYACISAVEWLKAHEHFKDRILLIRYENLVGPRGGGTVHKQIAELKKIADFLEVDIDDGRLKEVASKLYGGTTTFQKGQSKAYQPYFSTKARKKFWALFSEEMEYLGYTD
ncbi:sulfotransferase [bacterium]|nr:sulfotransferase [bacterium]